jgi:lysine 6-dehydrogenase
MPQLKPPFEYLILGAGRQGTAAAYDLARHGAASQIVLADQDVAVARAAAERVNALVEREVAVGQQIDVTDGSALRAVLGAADVALSAVPYYFNLEITRAAIDTQTHLCDMGGHTDVVMTQLALDDEARQAGISIVPDCGMGPGLINTMGAFAVELLDQAEEIFIYDAGLPQKPTPPWNYQLTFHINGLTNEMDGQAVFLRNGKITRVDTLTEPEYIEIAPLGRLEADVTSGGTSTAPWTFERKLRTYENKVLRYPGHFEWLRAYKALGLFSENPIRVGQQMIVPRQVYHALLEPKITAPHIEDICIVRSVGKGLKDGQKRQVTIDLVDRYDPQTGFTAMERLTGWHCAIMMIFQAHGEVHPGGVPMETAIPASKFMAEFPKRGIQYQVRWDEWLR